MKAEEMKAFGSFSSTISNCKEMKAIETGKRNE